MRRAGAGKSIPHPSIRKLLLFRLLAAVALISGLVLWILYQSTSKEVAADFDAMLAQEARVLGTLLDHEVDEERSRSRELAQLRAELGEQALQRSPLFAKLLQQDRQGSDLEDYLKLASGNNLPHRGRVEFLVRYADGQVMVRSPQAFTVESQAPGFQTLLHRGKNWRVYHLTMPDTRLQVQVSEDLASRRISPGDMLDQALWPLLFMIPLLGLIVWAGIGKGLQQLQQVASKVERQDPSLLEPISTRNIPLEVVPMVVALNRLFQRMDAVMENERRFTADASHELRNPITALKTQAQLMQLTCKDAQENRFLRKVIQGVDRMGHLLEQLLVLARADAKQHRLQMGEPVDLHAVATAVLSGQGHLALDKDIDLSLTGDEVALVQGDAQALEILLRNLLDNAIRYTPAGGAIQVWVGRRGRQIQLQVEDNGPGIPAELQDQLFQRFRRGAQSDGYGSGLGLSIVKRVAELHGARIDLDLPATGSGLLVRVVFPRRSIAA